MICSFHRKSSMPNRVSKNNRINIAGFTLRSSLLVEPLVGELTNMSGQMDTSANPSETAQPQTISVQPKKDKKKLWLMIIAVIVAILLIGSAAFVLMSGEDEAELTAAIDPDPVEVGAGETVELTVDVESGGEPLDADAEVEYLWSVSPISLGSFNLRAIQTVELTAGDEGGTGTVTCVVTYNDVEVTATADITVADPYLASVTINPASKTMAPDDSQVFTATA